MNGILKNQDGGHDHMSKVHPYLQGLCYSQHLDFLIGSLSSFMLEARTHM